MSGKSAESTPSGMLAEVKAAADDLIGRAARADVQDSDLFPYGVNRIAVSVRLGEIEVSVEISGPDHSHDPKEEEWLPEDDDDLFVEDD